MEAQRNWRRLCVPSFDQPEIVSLSMCSPSLAKGPRPTHTTVALAYTLINWVMLTPVMREDASSWGNLRHQRGGRVAHKRGRLQRQANLLQIWNRSSHLAGIQTA